MRPSEQLKRGRLDLEGVDLSQPAAVREHLFGKVLRVDKVEPEPLEPLALELTTSSTPRGAFRDPGSAAKTPCGPSGWPTRSCAAWKPIAGTPSSQPLPARRARLGPPRSTRLADEEPPERQPRRSDIVSKLD